MSHYSFLSEISLSILSLLLLSFASDLTLIARHPAFFFFFPFRITEVSQILYNYQTNTDITMSGDTQTSNAAEPAFQKPGDLVERNDDTGVMQLESLCMNCHENVCFHGFHKCASQ